jgi:hypothetical protein
MLNPTGRKRRRAVVAHPPSRYGDFVTDGWMARATDENEAERLLDSFTP